MPFARNNDYGIFFYSVDYTVSIVDASTPKAGKISF